VPVAQVSPVCLSFNATPSEFKPGADVTLYAQAVNPLDGAPLRGVKVQFLQNGTNSIGPYNETGLDGVASMAWQYPSDGSICMVNASVISDNTIGNCSLAVQPVTLTVGAETQMLLEAWRDSQGTGHTIDAQLVNGSGYPLQGQNLTVTVNGTSYQQQTNGTGYVTLHLALQPGDASANTYQVMASFNGTNSRSANLTTEDPYGDQYAVCITNQYDLRPSMNSSTLTVLLQSTDAITAAKTMEKMQQEAQDSGWFRVDAQWSWWYPWFKIHISAHVNPSLSYCLDLFGSGYLYFDGAQNKSDVDMVTARYGAVTEASLITAVSVGIAMFPENIAALIIGGTSLFIGTIVALGVACAYSGGAFCSYAWGMLPVLSIALLMTFQYPHPLVWLKSVADLWAKFSESPAISAVITSLTVCASLAMALIWPPPLRCMLSIPIILCIISIWIIMGF
jgi:hypothetical protein